MPGSSSLSSGCEVCGEQHHGRHFGIQACRACSSFWRRSLIERRTYTCRSNGKCNVLKAKMRNTCRACRLERCRQVGMREEIPSADIHESTASSSSSEPEYSPNMEYDTPMNLTSPKLTVIDPSNCRTKYLEKFVVHYKVFCSSERSMYMLEHPEDLFKPYEDIELKPLSRPVHLRLERGAASLVHTFLSDTTGIYRSFPQDLKLQIIKFFGHDFLGLHRIYVSANTVRKDKDVTVVVHHAFYWDESSSRLFFEGSDKLEEHMEFIRPIVRSVTQAVHQLRELNITEIELMAIIFTILYNYLHDLHQITPEAQQVVDSMNNELVYFITSRYGIDGLGPRLGRLHRFMHHIVRLTSEVREMLVMARMFFPYAADEAWDNLRCLDEISPPDSSSSTEQ